MAVCAEAVALGRAITDSGETGHRHDRGGAASGSPTEPDQTITVVSPCGSCRELIWDYDRNARIIVPSTNGPVIVAIGELLPEQVQPGADPLRIVH